jgi:hypothetical protein
MAAAEGGTIALLTAFPELAAAIGTASLTIWVFARLYC